MLSMRSGLIVGWYKMQKDLRIFVSDTLSVADGVVRKIRKVWRAIRRLIFRAVRSVVINVKTYTLMMRELGRAPSSGHLVYQEVGIPMVALWL